MKHLFTGKELDSTTGLYFYGARYYDPELGRFTSADTIVQSPYDPQSLNRYSYCRNNPINLVDPSGHSWWKKFWGQVASAVVGIVTTIATGGNFVLGFQAYSLTNTLIGTGQALAAGASPGRAFGSLAAGLTLSLAGADIIGGIGNLGLRMGAFALQGAAIGAAGTAIMGGNIGEGAAWGAGFGAITGFTTSQQVGNWQKHGEFMSNKDFAAQQRRLANMVDPLGGGNEFGIVSSKGHTGMILANKEKLDFVGKYPEVGGKESSWIFGKTISGATRNEFTMPQLRGPLISTSSNSWGVNNFQYLMASGYVNNPGTFALTTNCAEFALDTARYIGIDAPSNLTKFGFTDPAKVKHWLNSLDAIGADM